ncbi:MAG: type IV secretory system conjugative DNA transfer family protein [Planctomycetaceae bacterium]|nr:type IV secretory system conjugative DNA transfer family protein [Planctomycetaceae bacterium]
MFHRFCRSLPFYEAILERTAAISWRILAATLIMAVFTIVPVLGMIISVVVAWLLAQDPRSRSTSHGSAAWAGMGDLMRAGCVFNECGFAIGRAAAPEPASRVSELRTLLGAPLSRSADVMALLSVRKREGRSIPVTVSDRIPHLGVYGATGSMKTTAFAIPNLLRLQLGESCVVLDPKGELSTIVAPALVKRGFDVHLIDPFGVSRSGIERAQFNPLALFRLDKRSLVDEARRIANALVVRTGNEHDQFWPNASVSVITAVLSFLMCTAKPEEANLSRMRDLMSNPKLCDQMLEYMFKSDDCQGLLQRLAGSVMHYQGQTKASVYSVAGNHTDFLDSIPIAESVLDSSFDARRLVDGNMVVFVCLPVQRLTELAGLQRVIISTLINLVFDAGEDRHRRVHFLLDEAASLGSMDALYAAVQFGRSFGLRMKFLFQSASQVTRVFPDSQKDDFFATTGSVFAGTNDISTAKLISEMLGQRTGHSSSTQAGFNQGRSFNTGIGDMTQQRNHGTSDSTSWNEMARPLLRPEEVLQLPSHLAIVLLPNTRPILTEKTPWFREHKRHIIRRTFQACTNVVLTVVAVPATVVLWWAMTAGQQHPTVKQFVTEARSIFTH